MLILSALTDKETLISSALGRKGNTNNHMKQIFLTVLR